MPTPRSRPVSHVIETVAADFNLTAADLLGNNRFEPINSVRMLAIHLARNLAAGGGDPASYPYLARAVRRDHSTLVEHYRAFSQRMRSNPWWQQRYGRLRAALEQQLGIENNTGQDTGQSAVSTTLGGGGDQ